MGGVNELEAWLGLCTHDLSWLPWRDPRELESSLVLVETFHGTFLLRCYHPRRWANGCHSQAARLSEGSCNRSPILDCNFMAHLPMCICHQEHWPRRYRCNRIRAGRLLGCRCCRQGGFRNSHLGYRSREVGGGGEWVNLQVSLTRFSL